METKMVFKDDFSKKLYDLIHPAVYPHHARLYLIERDWSWGGDESYVTVQDDGSSKVCYDMINQVELEKLLRNRYGSNHRIYLYIVLLMEQPIRSTLLDIVLKPYELLYPNTSLIPDMDKIRKWIRSGESIKNPAAAG